MPRRNDAVERLMTVGLVLLTGLLGVAMTAGWVFALTWN